ncbi:serine/threonine-protein kinase [Kineosporia mesophila]|nr:serine/threonine-protein kinase [Kineosporia mesophila]
MPHDATARAAGDTGRIGQYRLVQRLGEGGMGVVHLGLDENGKAVAVKVLRPHIAGDPDARRRLAREVATLRRVRHPRVAGVLDADVEGDTPYVVTSFVPGKTLEKHVRDHGPLPRGHVARIGQVLADALRAIHAAGVVHRDVKPANVMLLDGEPVLIDFGIAHVADESRITHTGLVMGTPGYLSPEIIGGDAVSAATDWWGWGATLAYAATGRPPFGTGPIEVVLDRVRRGAMDVDGVDDGLRKTLTAALSVDPRLRPHHDELIAGLAAAAPSRPGGTGPNSQTPSWGSRGDVYVSPDEETQRQPGPNEMAAGRQIRPGDSTEIRLPEPDDADEMPTARTPPPSFNTAFANAQTSVIPPHASGGNNDQTSVIPPHASGGNNNQTSVIPPPSARANAQTSVIPPHALGHGGNNSETSVIPPSWGSAPESTRRFDAPRPNPAQNQNGGPANGFEARPQQGQGLQNQGPKNPGQNRGQAPVLAKGRPIGDDPNQSQPHHEEEERSESVLDRLPLGSMPLFLLGLLVVLASVAAVAPYGAIVIVAVGMIAARVVDRTSTALGHRRDTRGSRASDGLVTALSMPWRILSGALSTVFGLVLPALIGVSVAFIVASVQSGAASSSAVPGSPIPLAAGMVALLLTAWWGPGGGPVRRGTERVAAAITGGPTARLVAWAVIVLVLLSCLVVLQNNEHKADWGPLKSTWLVQQLTAD